MKKLFAMVLAFCLGSSAYAAGSEWKEDLDEAMKEAKKSGKMILIDFSGSDWCPACMMLDREVFQKKKFKKFAKKSLILVLIDFPRSKPMTKERRAKNEKLAKKFKIQYFPTVFLLDKNGKKVAQIDYDGDGVTKYINKIKSKM